VVENQKSTDTKDSDSEPLLVTDALKVHGISESMWLSTITILGNKITFKLDTGAEASVLPLKVYKRLKDKPMLENTTTKLSAYGGSVLTLVGNVSLNVNESLLLLQLDFLLSLKRFKSNFQTYSKALETSESITLR